MVIMMKKIYLIGLLSLVFDRLTKFLVIFFLKPVESIKVIPNFFSLTYVENLGAGFGILQNQTLLLVLVSGITLIILNNYLKTNKSLSNLEVISYGLIIGGIIGNLIDRIIYKYVIDFLSFKIFTYEFPVFNVADSSLVIGVIILIIYIVRGEINDRSKR